ncbi:MAG: acyl carrier protein [Ruminococcaceae bacterium]|jgi:acyl carrier protein|nr:acyl carrier protein [Oscillospiraceae bacterium]
MSIREEVLAVLKEVKPTKDLASRNDIIEGGYIDSFELMLLITTLNERFGIEITIDDMVPENFNSADSIAAMVERRKKN